MNRFIVSIHVKSVNTSGHIVPLTLSSVASGWGIDGLSEVKIQLAI